MIFETTVLNGLPVSVEFKPSVPEDWDIVAVNGKGVDPKWIYNRMTESEFFGITLKCMEKVDAAQDDELMEY